MRKDNTTDKLPEYVRQIILKGVKQITHDKLVKNIVSVKGLEEKEIIFNEINRRSRN